MRGRSVFTLLMLAAALLFMLTSLGRSRALGVVYSVGDPAELAIQAYGDTFPLKVFTNSRDFTISANCRLVLSTFNDGNGAFVQITDLLRGQLNAQHYADQFFKDSALVRFTNPSFSPDNTSYAVVGLKDGGFKQLLVSNGKWGGRSVYDWQYLTVQEVRWKDYTHVAMHLTNSDTGLEQYLLFDVSDVLASTEADLATNKPVTMIQINPDEFNAYLHESELKGAGLPLGTNKALTCKPFPRETR